MVGANEANRGTSWCCGYSTEFCQALKKSTGMENNMNRSGISMLIMALLCFVSFVANTISLAGKYREEDGEARCLTGSIELVLSFCAVFGSWTIAFCHQFPTSSVGQMLKNDTLINLTQAVLIITTLSYGARLLIRVYEGSCNEKETMNFEIYCNPLADVDFIPVDTAFLLAMVPVLYANILRESAVQTLLCSWLLGSGCLIASTAMLPNPQCLSFVIPMITLSLVLILDSVKLSITGFLMNQRIQELMTSREDLSTEEHKSEIRSLIGNVTHDLKTPLSSFMTGIDLIGFALDDFQKEISSRGESQRSVTNDFIGKLEDGLSNIRDTNAFMLMTINRCIDYTKAGKGLKLTPKFETVCLKEVLKLPLNCMKNIQDKVSIEMLPLPSSLCSHVMTDKQWLQENVLCLLSNAVKYSSGGKVTISVSHEIQQTSTEQPINFMHEAISQLDLVPRHSTNCTFEKEDILIEVEDHGIGVPAAEMEKLFQPFKQTQKLAGGTGLGLYSLAKRVEALHGQYGVKDRKDGEQGSLFWFSIPYKPDFSFGDGPPTPLKLHSTTAVVARSMSTEMSNSVTGSDCSTTDSHLDVRLGRAQLFDDVDEIIPLRILLVEDSPVVAKVTTNLLKRFHHEVEHVENGELATNAMRTILHTAVGQRRHKNIPSYDVVLMDLQMPVMDGFEAARRIREMETEHCTPHQQRQLIVGLSADPSCGALQLNDDFDDILAKPFRLEAFYEVLHRRQKSGAR